MTTRNMRPKPYVVVEFPTDEDEMYAALSITSWQIEYVDYNTGRYWELSNYDRYSGTHKRMVAYENIVITPKGKVLVDVDIPRWLEDCDGQS